MTLDEDDRPRPQAAPDLSRLSIDELKDRILDLEAEIERVRAEIARKRAVGAAAEGFFKQP